MTEKHKGIIAIDKTKDIDWEQRRYEMAKDTYCTLIQKEYPFNLDIIAKEAVRLADALIEELRKGNKL